MHHHGDFLHALEDDRLRTAAARRTPPDTGALERMLQAAEVPGGVPASLVQHFTGRIRAVARAHRLRAHDADDVVQTTWLRLLEHRDRIRDPSALGAWLHTTARHESLRIIRDGGRVEPVADDRLDARDPTPGAQERLEQQERVAALADAVRALPRRQRTLMAALLAETEESYAELAASLQMPIGSIGPTRARSLERLRQDPRLASLGLLGES
jgi:RNA polymerase sigma factor (sigma-70 family)